MQQPGLSVADDLQVRRKSPEGLGPIESRSGFPGVATAGDLADLYAVVREECSMMGRNPSEIEITVYVSGADADAPSTSIEEFAAAGVSRILLTNLPDDDLPALAAVLGSR